jgi:peptidoglycan/LPS O-acetylase OafA/YrhL
LQKRAHLPALTSLRGFAAVWVVLFHFQFVVRAGLSPPESVMRLIGHGHFAVDLFFLLSGYVIAYNYLDTPQPLERGTYLRFLYMRLARIYPVHLVGLLAVVPMVVVARRLGMGLTESGYGLDTFVQHLTLTQAWVQWMKLSWNYPAWSVSAEWLAYLLFPLLAVGLRRVRGVGPSLLLLAGCGGLLFLCGLLTTQTPYRNVLRVVAAFPVGAALFHVSRTFRPPPALPRWVALGSLSTLGVLLLLEGASDRLFFFLFAAILWSLAELREGELSWLCARPLLWLGEVSYSLYISHALVQKLLSELLPAERLATLSLPLRLAGLGLHGVLLLGAAYGMYRLIEVPARQGLKRLLERRDGARAQAALPTPR